MVLLAVAVVIPGIGVTSAEPAMVNIAFDADLDAVAARYVCVAKADNPHWSRKGRGETVLIKTRVTCSGPGAAQVRLVGTLSSSSQEGGPYRNRVSSDETRLVASDGTEQTFYTPRLDGPKVRGSAWYRATITATVVAPVSSGPWTATSKEVWVPTP